MQGIAPPEKLTRLQEIVSHALEQASSVLSEMINSQVVINAPLMELVPITQIPDLVGGSDTVVVTLYLAISGDIAGHLVFFLEPGAALELARVMLGDDRVNGDSLTDLDRSALGEVANVTGTSFLNSLADATRLGIRPSIPIVVIDIAGAVLNSILAELSLVGDEALLIKTGLSTKQHDVDGLFMLLPDSDSLQTILRALGA